MNARPNPATFIAFAVVTIALATTSFAQSKSYSKGTVDVTPANVATTAPGTPPTISLISGTAVVNITAPNVIVTTMTGGTLNVGAARGTASTVPVTIGTANGGSLRVNTTGNLTVSAVGSTAAKSLNVAGGSLNLQAALTVNGTLTMSGGSIAGSSVSATRFSLSAGTIDADLLGTGALTKTGAGTLTLNGAANNYTGATTVSAGTMVIGSAGRLPSGQALTVNGGTLDLGGTSASLSTVTVSRGAISGGNISATTTYSVSGGTISANLGGAAALTKTGAGTAILTGANDYSGTTTVSAGTLQVKASSLPSDVVNNGVLTFNQSTSETYSDVISGRGRLTKIGDGTLTLTGANVYTGGTTISGGTLAVSDGKLPLPSGRTTIVNNATLSFDNSTVSQVVFAAPVSGRGKFVKTGEGPVFLSGANTYTGGTTVADGVLAGTPRSLRGGITMVNIGSGVSFNCNTVGGTQSGKIEGLGSVTKTGSLTLTLTGENTYTGGTIVDGGTLSGSSISFPGDIQVTSGQVHFNQTRTGTYAGNISGAGSLTKLGAGALTLTGTNNTYAGGTTVTAGTLQGNSSNLQGTIVNNATVVFDQAASGEYAGVMSGRGRLTKIGNGTLTLSGGNQYTGGTTVSGGFLAGTVNSVQGNIVNNAHVQLTEEGSGTYRGAMSGTGVLEKLGVGTLTLTGRNTYRGNTIVSQGTLAGSTLSIQGSILNNGVVEFEQNSAGTYSGVMSGTGRLVKVGSGQLTLSGANDYTGGTLVNAGTLVGNASSLRGDIANDGGVTFNQAGTGTYAGAMTGIGNLTKTGSGTLILSGDNQYIGGTLVSAGTLQGSTSSLQGNIGNNARVVFDQATSGTYSGIMGGSGSLTKTGAGDVSLTGNNTYRGTTTLSGGGLYIEGNQAGATGALNVASNATLGGKGIIGGATTISGNHRIGQSAVASPDADTAGIQTFSRGLTYNTGANAFWRLMDNTTSLGTAGNYAYDQAVVGGILTASSAQALTFDMSFDSLGSVVDWSNDFWAEEREGTAGWLVYNAARLSIRGTLAPSGTFLDSTGAELSTVRPDYTFAFFSDTANGDLYLNYIYSP